MHEKSIQKRRRETIDEAHRTMLNGLLALVSVATWLAILFAKAVSPYLPSEITWLALIIEIICGISFWLRDKRLDLAIHVLLSGLWLCNILTVQRFGPALLPFTILIVLATGLLSNWTFGLSIAVASCGIAVMGGDGLAHQNSLLWMLAVWMSLLTGRIFFGSLHQSLAILWDYEDYAVRKMDEAREHRHELARLAKALKEAKEDLERANVQLRYAWHAAEDARRLKAQFAANVSHELRTPLNLIVGFSEMMSLVPQAYGSTLPPEYRADMRTLYRNAKHLQSLINDVLDISQIEAGQMAVVKEETDLREIILEAASLIRDLIESRGLTLKVVVPDYCPTLWLDRTRIRQVILNLLSNASHFTETGSITLVVSLEDASVRVSVSDTGIGIRAEDLGRVFEEFYQAENSLSKKQGTSGLGLALSKHFVELHGGRIWAESEGVPGKGSTFSFVLPIVNRSSMWDLTLHTPAGTSDSRYFVVMDTDPAVRALFERHTKTHRSIGAQTLEETVRLVRAVHPTAVIIDSADLQPQTLDAVRAADCQVPIVTCALPSGRRMMQRYNVADYLIKPVSFNALLDALEQFRLPIHDVLMIDDDPDFVQMFSRMLHAVRRSYQVWEAYSGQEGLAVMEQHRPDIVVLDLLMPDVDGFTVIQHMKGNAALADIPVVVVSARGMVDAITPSTEGKMNILKPDGFNPIELVRCIEGALDAFSPVLSQKSNGLGKR
jgi:signal transduction histidine kinase/CheY-like chemotaxis protein